MPSNSTARLHFDATALDQLACPACRGDLRLEDARLLCAQCRRAYPIVDGIPVLLVERAEGPGEETSQARKL